MESREFFTIPSHCHACSGQTTEEGDFLYCRNRACPAQLSGSIRVWISRLGLLNWGDSLINNLTNPDNPRVNSIADLYRLSVEDIAECSSGIKFAQKCYDVLHSNKTITLELLIASLNIPNLAVSTATDIVQFGFDTVDKILNLTYDDLIKVPNIGSITAKQILEGIHSKKEIIVELSKVLNISKPVVGSLTGKSFCITGATSKPRKAVEKMILDRGGVVKSSVTSGLNYLITNDPDTSSSKMKNAQKNGVTVISESTLYNMMDNGIAN